MCGTPFPHRPLTVLAAQSTLSFTSAPVEVVSLPLSARATEPVPNNAPINSAAPAVESIEAAISPEVLTPRDPVPSRAAAPVDDEGATPTAGPLKREAAEAAVEHATLVEPKPPIEIPKTVVAEQCEFLAAMVEEHATASVVEEPRPEAPSLAEPIAVATLSEPVVEPPPAEPVPRVEVVEPVPVAAEPAPLASKPREVAPPPVEAHRPTPAPRVIPGPAPRLRETPAPRASTVPSRPATIHPSPDSLPITPPPDSDGIPTFQSGVDAAGAPPIAEATVSEPVVEPPPAEPVPRVEVVEPVPVAAEPAPLVSEPREAAPPPVEAHRPTPAPRMIPGPAPRLRETPAPRASTVPSRPAAIHPSPDSLPITPPPDSAGMPTFQSVVDAAGAPPISAFEPPAKKDVDEDEELKEFVANFFYKPPDETADELTMRSEVPVIDKEEPAQFRHASFDDDVPPPLEAGAHPDGNEFIAIAAETSRPRFLDISESTRDSAPPTAPSALGSSFLRLDSSPSVFPEASPTLNRRWLMWSSLVILLLAFGGLGYLEGRAQITGEFSGPVEIARAQFDKLRWRIAQMTASTPSAPATPTSELEKHPPQQPQLAPGNQSPAAGNSQSDNGNQSASSTPSATAPTNPQPQTQATTSQNTPSTDQPSPSGPDATSAPSPHTTVAAEPAKPLDAPPPQPSNKPQPGQQELAKAMEASDPAGAAAWLWKATSRGNPEAPVRLADMYIKGKGVPRSCEQALVLLRSAAVKPNATARNRLAALYANGTCVARDRVRAYEFLSEALQADPTSEWADQNRKELWNQMTVAERAQAQKFR